MTDDAELLFSGEKEIRYQTCAVPVIAVRIVTIDAFPPVLALFRPRRGRVDAVVGAGPDHGGAAGVGRGIVRRLALINT